MQITFDPRYNVAYIQLRPKTGEVETLQLSDEINIDLAPDGTVFGIELLNANEQLGPDPLRSLRVRNDASGEEAELRSTG